MAFIKPTLSKEDFETSSGENPNYGKIVPEGIYTMVIGKKNEVRVSKAGNQYVNVQLNHTGDLQGSKPAFAMLMASGTKADGTPVKTGGLTKFLAALGITADDEYAIDFCDEGETAKALAIQVNGDHVQVEGRTVTAKLEVEEYNGQERNTVAWIVPASE